MDFQGVQKVLMVEEARAKWCIVHERARDTLPQPPCKQIHRGSHAREAEGLVHVRGVPLPF